MERRLGRGLGSLLGDPEPTVEDVGVEKINTASIRPNPHQPRTNFDPQGLEELRQSVESHGVLQPVLLRACAGGYELIAGERRWRAAQLAGLTEIPAVVRRDVTDADMLELALVENLQRRDLDPMEKAQGYRRMMAELGLTQEGVAAKVGLQRTTVTNHLRLLELPQVVQDAVRKRLLTMGHARAILGLEGEAAQVALMETAVRDDLSVREVERRARETGRPRATAPPEPALEEREAQAPAWALSVEARLREALGTRVQIQMADGQRGRLVIDFHDHSELERLLDRLAPRADVL